MSWCRFGFFHVLNNDYTHWQMYAIGGNQNPIIFSQGNRLITRDDNNAKAVTEREDEPYSEYKDWVCLTSSLPRNSQGDVMMNGACFNGPGGQNERRYV